MFCKTFDRPDSACRRRSARAALVFVVSLFWIGGFSELAAPSAKAGKEPRQSGAASGDKKKGKGKEKTPERVRIMVFSPDAKSETAKQVADIVATVQQSRLSASGKYRPLFFTAGLPVIRQALSEQTMRVAEVSAPFDNDAKAKRLTRATGYPMALVSSVDSCEYQADTQRFSLTLTFRLLDFSGEKTVMRVTGETAQGAEKSAKDANDLAPALQLARDLSERMMTELLKPARPANAPEKSDK